MFFSPTISPKHSKPAEVTVDKGAIFSWVLSDECTDKLTINAKYPGTDKERERQIAIAYFEVLKDESEGNIFREGREKTWNRGLLRQIATVHCDTPFKSKAELENWLGMQKSSSLVPGVHQSLRAMKGGSTGAMGSGSFGSLGSLGARPETILAFVLREECKSAADIKAHYDFEPDAIRAIKMFEVCKDPNSLFAEMRKDWDEPTLAAVAKEHAQVFLQSGTGFTSKEEVTQFIKSGSALSPKARKGTSYQPFV